MLKNNKTKVKMEELKIFEPYEAHFGATNAMKNKLKK